MNSLKLLTYNVHRGRSAFRRRDICSRIADILDFSSADVVCLQEVWQHEGFIRHNLDPHTEKRWSARIFGKNATFRQGAQGNAVLSNFSVLSWNNFDVSIARREQRGILHTVLKGEASDREIVVFCVHFGLLASERRRQVALLKQFIDHHVEGNVPLFIAGDFNDWLGDIDGFLRENLGMREVIRESQGRLGRTYPSYLPLVPLDRIYFRNCRLNLARVVRDKSCLLLSDHLPVEAEFGIY